MTQATTTPRRSRLGPTIFLVVAGLLSVLYVFIMFIPVDAANFESTTGLNWDVFRADNPEIVDYLTREARLLAVGGLGLSLLTVVTVWGPLRRGDGWAQKALWLFPLTMAAVAVIFLISGDAAIGGMYVFVALVTGLALVLSGPKDVSVAS